MTRSPSDDPASKLTVRAVVESARQHREENRLPEALALLEVAARLWPEDPRVRHQFGVALAAQRNEEGVEHLLAAVLQEPTNVEYLAGLAEGAAELGRVDVAGTWFRRALALAPSREGSMLRFGWMFVRAQSRSDAEIWMRRVMAVVSRASAGLRDLGFMQARLGHLQQSLTSLRQAIERDPKDGRAHEMMAVALRGLGAPEDMVMTALRIAAELMPERMETVHPLLGYLRDIGDEAAYMRYGGPHIERQMAAVAEDEIGRHGIRILWPEDPMIGRIGEIALQLDMHVKMKAMGWVPRFVTLLLAPKERVANGAFLDYFRSFVTVVDDPRLIEKLEPLQKRIPFNLTDLRLPDGRVLSRSRVYHAVQEEWQRQGRGPLLTLTQAHAEQGRRDLRRMGVPEGAWFVCLHVREPGYMKEGTNSSEAVRNANIANYLPAVEEIVRRGGWVIRLGDASVTPLPPMQQVIDYARSPFKSEVLDVFLMASCRFLLGTTSGPVMVSELFGVPVGAAD
ncbi:MAG: TIGR04372 family glycosyltransferase [Alphaproteobacteria bacterium]|nr:TIGR04372 family glycosyltransferase [Alphaproteobacteria bacterium]